MEADGTALVGVAGPELYAGYYPLVKNRCFDIAWDESFWVLIQMGAKVKRDDDYIRALLLEMEASAEWLHISALTMGASEDEVRKHFHMRLLADAGMLEESGKSGGVFRITNAGHDFLALIRKNENWEATKNVAANMGGASIQMLYRIAEGYAKQKLAEFGIPIA